MSFLVAIFTSAVIVLASPFMGQMQSFLRRSLSTENYVLLFGVGVLAAVGLAIFIAFVRIRERRVLRFGLLVTALVLGGVYMWWTSTPYAEVNAVERVHFVEYGLIALLFYRACRHAGDVSIVALPLLAAFTVGTLDEWLQWFVPGRVGEAHDVFLNLAAIVCGLLFAVALQPPPTFSTTVKRDSWRRMGLLSAAVWLVFAMFVGQVHLGHVVDIAGIGQFKSHYTEEELDGLQRHRATLWQTQPPARLRRLSQEDQYLDEGLWHVRRRNLAEANEAWRENLILERFFVPVLDIPTYASPNGNRWPAEQRADLAARADAGPAFISTAEPYPILAWTEPAFWSIVVVIAGLMAIAPSVFTRRRGA